MRDDPLFLLWIIKCPSIESCHQLQTWLPSQLTAETVFVDDIRAFPAGVACSNRESHRLGDYFESVQVLASGEESPMSFRLLFHRRPEAARYWKDLMVRILQEVRDAAAQATLEYRGDQDPKVA
jgi:hypothetical protein